MASPTSRPTRRCPRWSRRSTKALSGLNRYPDPTCATGCARALSKRYGVPVNRIAVGNGSCDILLAAGEALLEPGAEVVYAWPSFSVYPQISALTGATAVAVAARRRRPPRPRSAWPRRSPSPRAW